jgi:hypothetical protein
VPWWVYEKKKHYERSYWKHLKLNLETAVGWILFKEKSSWIDFEKEINPSWKQVFSNMIR